MRIRRAGHCGHLANTVGDTRRIGAEAQEQRNEVKAWTRAEQNVGSSSCRKQR